MSGSSSAASIHWTQPGLMALSETDGHGDTCGCITILDYRHLHDAGVPLDIATLDAERAELIHWGLMDTPHEAGMTISQIAVALSQHYGITPIKVEAFNSGLSWEQFHSDLIAALLAHQLVIYETSNASALPGNQSGVQYHFVLVGGIDSSLGFLTCNGDTDTALQHGGVVAPVWYSASDLQASRPCGYIVLPALQPAQPPSQENIIIERDGQGAITGAHSAGEAPVRVGAGFAAAIDQHGWTGAKLSVGETYLASGESVAVLRGSMAETLTYAAGQGVTTFSGAALAQAIEDLVAAEAQAKAAAEKSASDLAAAQQQIQHLQQELGSAGKAAVAIDALKNATE